MTDRHRPARIAGCAVAALLLGASIAPATAHATGATVRSVDTAGTTEPETTEPETTEPGPTEPETTEPGAAEPETVEDDGDDTSVAIIAVVAFAALIGLAGWWMVQRNDDDDAPHPRPPNLDDPLPGQDLL